MSNLDFRKCADFKNLRKKGGKNDLFLQKPLLTVDKLNFDETRDSCTGFTGLHFLKI